MIYVDIVSDTICPWCYIGKRRFERALEQSGRTDVAVAWRPFQLNPDMPVEGMTRDDYVRAKFGGGDRPRQIYQAIAESGREAGIDFQFSRIRRTPNTVLSHRLVHWSAGSERQDEVVGELFKAYFEEGRNVGDRAVLLDVAEAAGMDRSVVAALFSAGADVDSVKEEIGMARDMGVTGVPCFIIDNKYAVMGAQSVDVLTNAFREIAAMKAQERVGQN